MPEFDVQIAATVPAYATVRVRAATKREAQDIAARIARQGWKDPDLPIGEFEPEWDAMGSFQVFSVSEDDDPRAAGNADAPNAA